VYIAWYASLLPGVYSPVCLPTYLPGYVPPLYTTLYTLLYYPGYTTPACTSTMTRVSGVLLCGKRRPWAQEGRIPWVEEVKASQDLKSVK